MEGQSRPDPVTERPGPVKEPKRIEGQRRPEPVAEKRRVMNLKSRRLDARRKRQMQMRMGRQMPPMDYETMPVRSEERRRMEAVRCMEAETRRVEAERESEVMIEKVEKRRVEAEREREVTMEKAEVQAERMKSRRHMTRRRWRRRVEMDEDRMKAEMEEEKEAKRAELELESAMDKLSMEEEEAEMERFLAEFERQKAEREAKKKRAEEGIRIFQVWWDAWLKSKREDREESVDRKLDKTWKMWDPNEDLFIELCSSVSEEKAKELRLNIWKKKKVEQELEAVEDAELMTYCKKYIDHRNWWKKKYPQHGQFEDITKKSCMYYSCGPVPHLIVEGPPPRTVQVFSVKIGGSNWPLQLYGLIALRDFIDPQRNVIFNRDRDECQIVTKEDPYLSLTGPTRSVVINMNESMGPLTIEAELKVRGTVESEDKYIILDAISLPSLVGSTSFDLAGPNMKLEISLGAIERSVEATIFIRVVNGTWPTGFHGQFVAKTASIECNEVILLEFSGDGEMKQSRYVVSVEASGILIVTLKACNKEKKGEEGWEGKKGEEVGYVIFNAFNRGRSSETLNFDSCSIEVHVAWSLIYPYCPELAPWEFMDLINL